MMTSSTTLAGGSMQDEIMTGRAESWRWGGSLGGADAGGEIPGREGHQVLAISPFHR
jgi:hypothetical protein